MIDHNIGLILGLFLKHLLRFCDLRPGNTDCAVSRVTDASVLMRCRFCVFYVYGFRRFLTFISQKLRVSARSK